MREHKTFKNTYVGSYGYREVPRGTFKPPKPPVRQSFICNDIHLGLMKLQKVQ